MTASIFLYYYFTQQVTFFYTNFKIAITRTAKGAYNAKKGQNIVGVKSYKAKKIFKVFSWR